MIFHKKLSLFITLFSLLPMIMNNCSEPSGSPIPTQSTSSVGKNEIPFNKNFTVPHESTERFDRNFDETSKDNRVLQHWYALSTTEQDAIMTEIYKRQNQANQSAKKDYFEDLSNILLKHVKNNTTDETLAAFLVDSFFYCETDPSLHQDFQTYCNKLYVPIRKQEQRLESRGSTGPLTEKFNSTKNIAEQVIKERDNIKKHIKDQEEYNQEILPAQIKALMICNARDFGLMQVMENLGESLGLGLASGMFGNQAQKDFNASLQKDLETYSLQNQKKEQEKELSELMKQNDILFNGVKKKYATKEELLKAVRKSQ